MAKDKKAPVTDDEDGEDFAVPVKPAKKAPAAKAAPQPPAKVEVPDEEELEPVIQPVQVKLSPRLIEIADEWGLSPADVRACKSDQELKDLIKDEKDLHSLRREKQMGSSGAGRDGSRAGNAPAPEAPANKEANSEPVEVESDLVALFENLKTAKGYDGELMDNLKTVAKEVLTLRKNSNPAKIEQLEKDLKEAQQTLQQMRAKNDPIAKRANAVISKYTALFGTDLNEDGIPPQGTDEYDRYEMMYQKAKRMQESGKWTNEPEKDIPAVINSLWPGHKPKDTEVPESDDEPVLAPKKTIPPTPAKKPGMTRIDDWNDSGQAPAVNRNGANKSGVPSEGDAVQVVAKKLKERGIEPGPIDSVDDEPDF